MAVNSGYNAYKQNSVMTASPQELTLMLYNGAIKFCNLAIVAIDNMQMQNAHNYIIRVQDIITEFQITLDKKYDISKNLSELYEYIHARLVEANVSKDKDILNEVLELIREMRDVWKEAMALSKKR